MGRAGHIGRGVALIHAQILRHMPASPIEIPASADGGSSGFPNDSDRSDLGMPLAADDAKMSGMTWRDGAARRVKLTYDDLLPYSDDGLRHELIDGVHYVSPSPNTRHQRIVRRLSVELAQWVEDHPAGEVFFAPFDVVFTRVDVVVPDLVYISAARAAVELNDRHTTGADLVVEILSPSTRQRDRRLKRDLYERAGVVEYWVVDPDADTIQVHRRRGERFGVAEEFLASAHGVLRTGLLPGFELALDALFAR